VFHVFHVFHRSFLRVSVEHREKWPVFQVFQRGVLEHLEHRKKTPVFQASH
jgi:hypothetical protein